MTAPHASPATTSASAFRILAALGFPEPTPIQREATPALAEGASVHGLAPTGSGKTLAFLIPLLARVVTRVNRTQVLILAPTRELGAQIARVAETVAAALASESGERAPVVRTAFGGHTADTQKIELLKGPHVVVATPGRALDLIEREVLPLSGVNAFVLDEADHMLAMGFIPDVGRICEGLPKNVQTALFSATPSALPGELEERLLRGAQRIDVRTARGTTRNPTAESNPPGPSGSSATPTPAEPGSQSASTFHEVLKAGTVEDKARRLMACLRGLEDSGAAIESGIVFCETREMVSTLSALLRTEGFSAGALSGELGQIQRATVLRRFKAEGLRYLVATNIAARGIDISDLSVVVNFDLPSTAEDYVHRAGRTGRAGKSGRVINVCTPGGEEHLRRILAGTPVKLVSQALAVVSQPTPTQETNLVVSIRGSDATHAPRPQPDTTPVSFRRVHLNRGKANKIRPGDILGALTKQLGLAGSEVGSIFIFDHFTHIEVPERRFAEVVQGLSGLRIKNMTVKASEARS